MKPFCSESVLVQSGSHMRIALCTLFGQHNVAHPTHAIHIGIVNLHRVLEQLRTAGWNLLQCQTERTHTEGGSVSQDVVMQSEAGSAQEQST